LLLVRSTSNKIRYNVTRIEGTANWQSILNMYEFFKFSVTELWMTVPVLLRIAFNFNVYVIWQMFKASGFSKILKDSEKKGIGTEIYPNSLPGSVLTFRTRNVTHKNM
jgi:hypothetical protein